MKCVRCGYCCFQYVVVVIRDINKPLSEKNVMIKHTGDRCPYLEGRKPGKYSCRNHGHRRYKNSPCDQHSQIERRDSPCRMGKYVLSLPSDKAMDLVTHSFVN